MNRLGHRRAWLLVGLVAIVCMIFVLLIPQVHPAPGSQWIAIIPLIFLGLISGSALLLPQFSICIVHVPNAPALPAAFQRPPPVTFA